MSKTKKILIFLAFSAVLWLLIAGWGFLSGRQGSSVDPIYNDIINATELDASFVYEYEGEADDLSGTVHGVILPSPSSNSAMTARTMAALSKKVDSKLVMVVSFAEDLDHDVVSSWYDWQTPFGIVQVNGAAISHLLEQGTVTDGKSVKKATDIADFMPYFSYYFPDKRVVPVVFDSSVGIDYVKDFMTRVSWYGDGYFAVFLTPEQPMDQALFSSDPEVLANAFGNAEYTDIGGTIAPVEMAELNGIRRLLQYDGNTVLKVMTDPSANPVDFDEIAVIYGKE
ncbi:MAG: hypothetical protein IJO94_05825 [Firmicutes bacterium]|nr:hypothetical protein [Bacillota bacterium]